MTRTEATPLLTYPLATLARELDQCSPTLRRLIEMATTGTDGGPAIVGRAIQESARLRLLEVVTTRTKEARDARAA